ncbi:hypothetical protein P886_0540 [Alteromonadaceae bacterium 2753L.S.0a.02]|nr:hypothetical protein P886_0540 [Alteromonadaceae bacterium 2753L.S.0a.02]
MSDFSTFRNNTGLCILLLPPIIRAKSILSRNSITARYKRNVKVDLYPSSIKFIKIYGINRIYCFFVPSIPANLSNSKDSALT